MGWPSDRKPQEKGEGGRCRGFRGQGGPPTVSEHYVGWVGGGPSEGYYCKTSPTYVADGGVATAEPAFAYGPAAWYPVRNLYAAPQRFGVGLRGY